MRINDIAEAKVPGKPQKFKSTDTFRLAGELKHLPFVEKIIDMHSIGDGTAVFVRTKDGEAYEIQIRPSYYGDHFKKKRGIEETKPSVKANE